MMNPSIKINQSIFGLDWMKKQFAQVVCEERQFNLVFMNVMKDADVFAYNGNRFALNRFINDVRVFDEDEIIVQNVHDRVALVVQSIQMGNALRNRRGFAQTIARVSLKHAKADVGAQLIGQLQRNWQPNDFELLHVVD